jgi:hypothetical protein
MKNPTFTPRGRVGHLYAERFDEIQVRAQTEMSVRKLERCVSSLRKEKLNSRLMRLMLAIFLFFQNESNCKIAGDDCRFFSVKYKWLQYPHGGTIDPKKERLNLIKVNTTFHGSISRLTIVSCGMQLSNAADVSGAKLLPWVL